MLTDQDFSAACVVLRSMYTSLIEVEELTQELSQAVTRQDQVSVRMFLTMRQAEIERLTGYQKKLRHQCDQLPSDQGQQLREMLTGTYRGSAPAPGADALLRQAEKNRSALERIRRADQTVSRRLAGPNSFYTKKKP